MIIESEPNGLLMVRYKFYFNQQFADPEDAWVLDYLQENGLQPRRELQEEYEGVSYKVLHFGQCYLARHVGSIGDLYKKGVEHSALANRILEILNESPDADVQQALESLEDLPRFEAVLNVALQLYEHAEFEASDDQQQLAVAIDPDIVVQTFRMQHAG